MNKKNTTKAVETKAAENKKVTENKKAEVKKVPFDKKVFFNTIQSAFSKDNTVDVVADTEREDSINASEYEYIHFYKKGTEKNLFQMYVKNSDVKFVVGVTLKDFLKQGKNFTVTPVEKSRNGEKKVVYIRVTCNHEDAVVVAETIINAYTSRQAEIVDAPEKKKASAKKKVVKKDA